MNEIEQKLKSNLKNKVSITKAILISFLMTGGISLANGETTTPTNSTDKVEKAVDIFKDVTKVDVDKHGLQELMAKPKFTDWTRFDHDNPREMLYLKLREIGQKLINMETYDKTELLSMQNEISQLKNNAWDGAMYERNLDGIEQMNMLYKEVSNFIYNITNQNLDKETYKNQMDRLAKIVDRNSEKAGTVNENRYEFNITNIDEAHGLELGSNSYARGTESIVTSRNGIAIGNGAVATGGDNLSGEDIQRKLQENKAKVEQIQRTRAKSVELTNQVKALQQRQRDVIEAGIRVEEIRKSKAKAEKEATRLKTLWETETQGSQDFFRKHQTKLDDLNSRLTGVGKLKNNNIQTPEGLEKAITEFKHNVEDGTKLNLSRDFYKDYITSYYKALGDLRLNKIKYENLCSNATNHVSYGNFDDTNSIIYKPAVFYNSATKYLCFGSTSGDFKFDNMDFDKYMETYGGGKSEWHIINYTFKKELNIYNDILTQSEYEKIKDDAVKIKNFTNKHLVALNKDTLLTEDEKQQVVTKFNAHVNIYQQKAEVCYYQGEYERTKNTTYLDKKVQALDKLKKMCDEYEKLPKIEQYRQDKMNQWYKENITDVENKNKITTEKLTSELEKALGVNKNAIKERQQKLDRMKSEYEQAERNAKGLNPSEKDLILSREYEKVKKELETLTNELKENDEKLKALQDALTLHNLKDKGKDNFAQGTDALAIGDDAYAIGTKASAIGEKTLSIGKKATTIGKKSGTIGVTSTTNGENSYTLGNENIVYGNNNITIGNKNKVGKDKDNIVSNNIVIGSNITSNVNNAIVFGNESKPISGAVSFGNATTTRQLKYIAEGTDDTDAVNFRQLRNYVGNELGKITLKQGSDGKSAYDVWKEYQKEKGITNDEELTKEKYFEALKGAKGQDGKNGSNGKDGQNGKSAFEIWKELQKKTNPSVSDNELTEDKFLNSLKGKDGKDGTNGKSAYDVWKEYKKKQGVNDSDLTEEKYLESIKGARGEKGEQGEPGTPGQNGKAGKDGLSHYDWWLKENGKTDSDETKKEYQKAIKGKKGDPGTPGKDGVNGKSAFEEWKSQNGNGNKTYDEFLESLKGKNGTNGKNGANGLSAYELWLKENNKKDNAESKKEYQNSIKGAKGEKGTDGTNGKDGKSAFDIWKELQKKNNPKVSDSELTENNFLNSLKGKDGKDGSNGTNTGLSDKDKKEMNNKFTAINKTLATHTTEIKGLTDRVGALEENVKVIDKKADLAINGISNAVAMANLPQVSSYGKYKHMLTAAYGNYGGANAVAIGFSGTTDSRKLTYKVSGAVNTKGNLAFGAGIGVMLGEVKTTEVDNPGKVKEELIKAQKERNQMQQQIEDMAQIIQELRKELNKK